MIDEHILKDAARFRWLKENAKEVLLRPQYAGSEFPDMRTCWQFPVLMCSGAVGGYVEVDRAIDILMGADD